MMGRAQTSLFHAPILTEGLGHCMPPTFASHARLHKHTSALIDTDRGDGFAGERRKVLLHARVNGSRSTREKCGP